MTPRTPEQNEEIRQQTRQQIIDAAFELFAKEGYSHTSVSTIAKKANISKGLIYHYFDSKQAILSAIFDQLVEVGDEVLDFPDDFSAADKIRQTIEKTFEFIENQTGVGRLMIALALQPETYNTLKPKIDEVNKRQTVLYVAMLKELGFEKPEIEAYRIGATMDGVLMGYASMGDDYPLEEMKQKILEEYVPN